MTVYLPCELPKDLDDQPSKLDNLGPALVDAAHSCTDSQQQTQLPVPGAAPYSEYPP